MLRLTVFLAVLALLVGAGPAWADLVIDRQQFVDWGMEVYEETVVTLGRPGERLFYETAHLGGGHSGGIDGRAFAWPTSTQFKVHNLLAKLDPATYAPVLREFSDQFHSNYWSNSGGGYRACVAGPCERFYDDNAHVLVALAEAHEITGEQVYLDRAKETLAFVLSGEDLVGGGGTYWSEYDHSFKDSAGTLQGARGSLMIYQATGEPQYLEHAQRLYNWAKNTTQQPDGLFKEKLYLTGPKAGQVGDWDLVHYAGYGISTNVEFYEATGDPAYLTEARRIANRSIPRYIDFSTGRINDEGQWAFELIDGFAALYEHDGDARWLEAARDGLVWLHDNKRDPQGHYGLFWGREGPQMNTLSSWNLNDQAPVARAYLRLGTVPESSTLTWDENDPGNWGDPRWVGDSLLEFPNHTTHAVVRTNTVTVAADRSALTLTVSSGGVVIAATGGLTVSEQADIATSATLDVAGTLNAQSVTVAGTHTITDGGMVSVSEGVDVAADATLDVAGTLNAQSLTTAGTSTFGEGALGTIDTINVTDGTTTLSSPNISTINAIGGILNTAANVTDLNVDGGTVNTTAEVSTTNLEILSGRVNLHGGNLNVGTMQVAGGTVDTGADQVVVSDTLKIGDRVSINVTGATFQVNSSNLADPAEPQNLTLTGGRLTIDSPPLAPDGAIAIWKFDERDGPITPDSSTADNDHRGTLHGAERVSDDPDHRTVLSFDGNAYVEAANTGDIQFGNPFTIGMWIKTSQKGGELIGKDNGDGRWRMFDKALYVDGGSGQVTFAGPISGTLTGSSDVANGEWHHLVVTFNDSTAPGDQEIYIDGDNDTHPAGRLYIGAPEMGEVFRLGSAEIGYQEYIGLMDDVYIYSRSLSPAEVVDLYQAFSSALAPKPNTNLRVTADSALHLETVLEDATLGNLMLDPGVALEVTGAAVRFHDVTATDGSSIEGNIQVGGILSPGNSVGTLSVTGELTMQAGSTYRWELGSSANDLVKVDLGTLLLETGWKLQLHALGGRAVEADDQLCLFTFGEDGSLEGSSDLAMDWEGAVELLGNDWDPANANWNPTLHSDTTGVYITGVVAVPEPATLVLLATGGLCLLAYAWRRRNRTS